MKIQKSTLQKSAGQSVLRFLRCSNNYELVEMRGLAPLYRQTTKRLSTCVVCLFFVPSAKSANRPNRR